MSSRPQAHDGAVAIIVAICLLLIFAAGAIAIDLGSAWETKRAQIVDTDAAALAGARELATSGDCALARDAAEQLLQDNTGRPGLTLQPSAWACIGDTVTVDYTGEAQQALSGGLTDSLEVFASSTATFLQQEFGPLRPMVICYPDLPSGTLPPADPPDDPISFIVGMGKTWNHSQCGGGGGSGTWGWNCFDQFCQPDDIETYIDGGYPGTVTLGSAQSDGSPHPYVPVPPSDEDCEPGGSLDWCQARTGTEQQEEALTELVGKTFSIIVSDCIGELEEDGSCDRSGGSNTEIHPYAFAYVRLDAWCERKNSKAIWFPSDAPFTEKECLDADTSNNVPVLALSLFGTRAAGTPEGFTGGETAQIFLCDGDHMDGVCPEP